jgi:hypothetical protein
MQNPTDNAALAAQPRQKADAARAETPAAEAARWLVDPTPPKQRTSLASELAEAPEWHA